VCVALPWLCVCVCEGEEAGEGQPLMGLFGAFLEKKIERGGGWDEFRFLFCFVLFFEMQDRGCWVMDWVDPV